MRETQKKVSKLKAAEVERIIQRKEEQAQELPAGSIYENSNLYKRETVEARMDKISALMQDNPEDWPEEQPKSWLQIKAAASIAKRKADGTSVRTKLKKAKQPKRRQVEEAKD